MKNANHEIKMTKKAAAKKWVVRVFALLLSLLLVSGTFYYLIAFFSSLA
jgi:hypothetical protein